MKNKKTALRILFLLVVLGALFFRIPGLDVRRLPRDVLPTYGGVVWRKTTLLVSRSALALSTWTMWRSGQPSPYGPTDQFFGSF